MALRDGVCPLPLLLQVPGLLAPSSHNGPLVSTPRRSFPWLELAQTREASYDLPGRAASSSSRWLQPCGGGGDIVWRGQLLVVRGACERDVWHRADTLQPKAPSSTVSLLLPRG